MAAKEAALAGVPVVGSAVGGIPDYIVPGENGLLFPSGDLQACSQAVRNAVTHPLFGRGLVDPRRLAAVREQLSPERMARSFAALYRECHENAMHSK
jgi:glycosyltransferase involved in cell wall biosynthesis